MIRIANISDLNMLSEMMYRLYKEINPEYATEDMQVYRLAVAEHINNDLDTVYIEDNKGFFIVRDESEPMTPGHARYNGIRVYIEPEHRHSRLLANFYKRLFKDFPNGEILGVTEIHSPHIKVLDKRHNLVAQIYRLERS
jgi:hypothetical protein